ncbi:MAG: nuclease-related domain-containing protein [Candidatus Thermoplasmatota archaeon]|nr:nuclease-related domain-containing protein [Candidatus Thermoplasmatota archaeon]
MSLLKRFSWLMQRRKKFPHDDIHRAGDLAEMRLAKLSRAAGKNNGWQIYQSVRIPDPDGGRREIDMVVIGGNTIYIVEQKHWAGSFRIDKEHHFIQRRKNGQEHNHDGVADRIARKARLLMALHQKRLNLSDNEMPEVRVIVAMTHPKLEWPKIPSDLSAEMVNEQGFLDILKTENPGKPEQELIDTMSGFNTWDEVHMHGGLLNKGDVFNLGLGDELEDLFQNRDCKISGNAVHRRGWLSIFDKQPSLATLKIGKKNAELRIANGAMLSMHVVGESNPRGIPWASIDRIELSKPAAEWNR